MAYIPKHKINKLIAQEGIFIFVKSQKPYVGPYIETARGKYYAGEDPYNLNKNNLLEKIFNNEQTFSFSSESNTKIYNIINKNYKKTLSKLKNIPSNKPQPTKKDYEKFKFERYFAKRINSKFGYFEIDKKTHKSIESKKSEYDFNLYTVGKIEWALVGETQIININTLKEAEKNYPGLSLCFKNLKEYKSTKNPGIFTKLDFYDPYKKEGMTSSQLRSAIEHTNSQKIKNSPEKLIDPDNFKLYNIEGRYYMDGTPIPNNLPSIYGLPQPISEVLIQNQNCSSCYFNNYGLCEYWNAYIKNEYWCASWVNYQEEELRYQEFQDQVIETITTETSTISSIGDNTLDRAFREDNTSDSYSSPEQNTSGEGGGY